MQSAIVNNICPLCRRESASADADFGSRLCWQCRGMLEPIVPKPQAAGVSLFELQASTAPVAHQSQLAVAPANGNGHAHFAAPVIPAAPPIQPYDLDSQMDESDLIEEIEEIELVETLDYADLEISLDPAEEDIALATAPEQSHIEIQQPATNQYEAQADAPLEVATVEPASEAVEAYDEAAIVEQAPEAFHYTEPKAASVSKAQPVDDFFATYTIGEPFDSQPADESYTARPAEVFPRDEESEIALKQEQATGEARVDNAIVDAATVDEVRVDEARVSEEQADESQADVAQAEVAAQAADYNSATDPWDDPLPAWDQSQNEWPVMLAPDRPSTTKRLRVPLAILFVAALGAAAYFLFFNQATQPAPARQSSAAQEPLKVPSAPPTESASAVSEPPAQALPATQAPAENQQPQAATSETTTSESEGRFALQIASMPNEAAANEMAARLKADGLPAYVVSADLGSRGVWFRVRVGRFETAEEARSFAAKSRLEARVERNDN